VTFERGAILHLMLDEPSWHGPELFGLVGPSDLFVVGRELPVVMTASMDPLAQGLIQTLGHPGKQTESIDRAVVCLWISAGLTTVAGILQIAGFIPVGSPLRAAVAAAISAAISAVVAVKISEGRIWARYFFLAVYILGALTSMLAFSFAPSKFISLSILGKVSAMSHIVLDTTALILMFFLCSPVCPANGLMRCGEDI